MTETPDIASDLQERVDALAQRLGVSPAAVISDALEHGHSLEWQERFARKVAEGAAAADQGDFAEQEEIERVLAKHRPT